jgi:hypothetical protein
VDFSLINPTHQNFIANVGTRINPIENLRNDIMHNRRILPETINDFEQAKLIMLEWISNFWEQEASYQMDSLKQAYYILRTLLDSCDFSNADLIYFKDLNLEEQEADDLEDLKTKFLDIINNKLQIDDQTVLTELISNEINRR